MIFIAFLIAVGIVVGLTILGAYISRRAPGTSWQAREDHPLLGPHDHFHH